MNAQRWPVRAWLKRGVPYGSVVLAGVVLGFVALAQSSPEINVERPASFTIVDGGTDAQGNRPVGVQQTLTYTVRNAGTATLNVTLVASASASNVTVDAITPTSFTVSSGGGTATFDVRYTPTAEGSFSFELDLANDDADEGNYDITVSGDALNHPTIDKAFSPTTIGVGGISTLTFTLTNLNAGSGLTGLNFTDALPAGVEIATTPNLGGTCGAVATNFTPNIAAGGTSINLTSGVSLAASGSCTIFVDVNGASSGAKVNTTGNVGSTELGAGTDSATDTLIVGTPASGGGAITFVSPAGNDANDCLSLQSACATIQAGVDAVDAGGTVVVLGGAYSGGVTINKALKLVCEAQFGGSLAASISGGPGITIAASDVTVSGFTFQGFATGATAGVVVNSGSGVRISGNAFIDLPSDAGLHRNGGTVDAANNWWGCNAGPNTANCTKATGGADADPWLVATLEATPNPAPPGESVDLIVDVSRNSDGEVFSNKISRPVTVSADGGVLERNHVPALPVGFPGGGWLLGGVLGLLGLTALVPGRGRRAAATLVALLALSVTLSGCGLFGLFGGGGLPGGVSSVEVTLINGLAVVTLTSAAPGTTVTVTATVDNQILTIQIVFQVVRDGPRRFELASRAEGGDGA